MLTLFAIPKSFRGHFGVIQTNAIESWVRLSPRPEVVLLGSDEGTDKIAKRLGLRHIPAVARNRFGTPLVDDVFGQAEAAASNDLLCYINSDIILMDDFMIGVRKVAKALGSGGFLGVGRKLNAPLHGLIDFGRPGWDSHLRAFAMQRGRYVTPDSDYFLYPRGQWKRIPPFAIGRCYWSSWFVFQARRRGLPVVDMTPDVMAIEPTHDYSHARSTGGAPRLGGEEFRLNGRLFRGCKYLTTIDATHILAPTGFTAPPFRNKLTSLFVRAEYRVYFMLKGTLYPYSSPLIAVGRALKSVAQVLPVGRRVRRT